MRVCQVLALYVVGAPGLSCGVHYLRHGVLPLTVVVLDSFCLLNLLICLWELALCYRSAVVVATLNKLRERFPDTTAGRFGALKELFLFGPVPLFSASFWTRVWATYALYDPSYADDRSWGFWVDVGNGHTTLLPSLLWVVGTTYRLLPPRPFALIGLVAFYQELYGTVVYFATFLYHRRYRGKTRLEVALFVGLSNAIWIVLPLFGCFACLNLIQHDSYDLFYPAPAAADAAQRLVVES